MSKITEIRYKADKERYWVFVDGEYCTSIRKRTFPALKLTVGQEIDCEAIKELESHHWKNAYGKESWDKEKVRLNKVKALIEQLEPRVQAHIVGFGADTSEFIAGHPDESGKPDIEVRTKHSSIVILLVEVSGTEVMRGKTYWVRPDKLLYAKNHPDQDVWIILHYNEPQERFVFIKPNPATDYPVVEKKIRESVEIYVEFDDGSPDVKDEAFFATHLRGRV